MSTHVCLPGVRIFWQVLGEKDTEQAAPLGLKRFGGRQRSSPRWEGLFWLPRTTGALSVEHGGNGLRALDIQQNGARCHDAIPYGYLDVITMDGLSARSSSAIIQSDARSLLP